jgi:hypothetical protein
MKTTNRLLWSKYMQFIIPAIFSGIFLISGALMAFNGFIELNKAISSRNWPSVQGVIIFSHLEKTEFERFPSAEEYTRYRNAKQIIECRYSAVIVYEYMVNHKKYESNTIEASKTIEGEPGDIQVMNSSGDKVIIEHYKDRSKRITDTFPAGRSVAVYYNQNNPGESLLVKGTSKAVYLMPVLGSIFIIAGIIALIVFLRSR